MIVEKNNDETFLKCDENSVSDFFVAFKENYTTFNSDNLILDFSGLQRVETEDILVFLQHATEHKQNGMSFVVVVNDIDYNNLPDELVVVPTVLEARDMIEMDKIERDLGF